MRQLKRVLKPSDQLVIEEPDISGSALPPVSFRVVAQVTRVYVPLARRQGEARYAPALAYTIH
jgi:hypothetical protein